MLYNFLTDNRAVLINRCRAMVSDRRSPAGGSTELEHGISLFLDQLTQMLPGGSADPGAEGRTPDRPMSIGETRIQDGATQHGKEMLLHHFTIDQVVRDYGDLCQAITQVSVEQDATISSHEFGILNIRLDNAIASAVTEFARPDERLQAANDTALEANERLGALAHEMRNLLNTAILAIAAIKGGSVGLHGATAGALDRSLIGMRALIDNTLADVRLGADATRELIEIGPFILQVQVAAALEATQRHCELSVLTVQPGLFVEADRHILASAVANLLQNAFQVTRDRSHVQLRAYASKGRIRIEVEDESGGLPQDMLDQLFRPDKAGMRLGLAISRKSVEASGGTLFAHNVPGRGCVCVIDLPQKQFPAGEGTLESRTDARVA